jgi:DNA-binding SARP family transcriptional activator/pimeloyl-ACP methyl ester carboxylesterase
VVQVLIRTLGAFEVQIDDRLVLASAWSHRRASDLVKLLALTEGHRLHRDRVIDAFWPDLGPEAGAANLHKAAHYARKALGSAGAVVLRESHLALWPAASIEVDAHRFEERAVEALTTGDPDGCREAAGLYRGELLPDDRNEEWVLAARDRLRELYLRTLRRAGLWERVVDEEPTDEASQQALIRMYADAGNRYAALIQFHSLRDALASDGLQPDPESLALYREIVHAPIKASPIRYVRNRGVSIAYQVVDGGPADLLMIPGWVSHLALDWEEPLWVAWCERMTSFARLIRFDKRGTGLSDRPPGIQPLEERMEDARAVADAAGVAVVDILGWSEGGPLAMLFAATYPERVRSLVLYGTQACFVRTPDYPWGVAPEERELMSASVFETWGQLDDARYFATRADERFATRYAAYQRAAASPATAADLNRMNLSIDARDLLERIDVPTLVVTRRGDPVAPVDAARYMAERIRGARFVELEGDDHLLWVGDIEALCGEIEGFLARLPSRAPANPRSPGSGAERRKVLGRSSS